MLNTRRIGFVALCLGAGLLISITVIAQQQQQQQQQGGAGAGGMTPQQMEMMMKMAAPGPQHAALTAMAGEFNADCTMVMDPSAPPQKSAGKAHNEMILGGRFIQTKFKGSFMGSEFDGIGFTGYDNMKKKYVSTWMDSMGTMIMMMEGTGDASGKTITLLTECLDPSTGKNMKMRSVTMIESNDKHTMEMYNTPEGGSEYKCMTIVYTRAK